jgi:hypothetical protein
MFTVVGLLYDFLSLTNAVNVPSKRNKHKNLEEEEIFFVRRKEQDPWPDLSFFCLLRYRKMG